MTIRAPAGAAAPVSTPASRAGAADRAGAPAGPDPAAGLPRAGRVAQAMPGEPAAAGQPPRLAAAGGKTSRHSRVSEPAAGLQPGDAGLSGERTACRDTGKPGRGDAEPPRPGQGLAAMAAAMSEGELEEKVRKLCEGFGILRFHTPDSRRVKERGLPDDILIGPRGVLWRELKNMKRKLTPEQEKVGERLTALGQDWAVWRPDALLSQRIERELWAISGLRVAAPYG